MSRKIIPEVCDDHYRVQLPSSATVREAAQKMRNRHVGAVLVVSGERLEGIFTERDVVNRVVAEGLDPDGTTLATVMTTNPDTIAPTDTAITALRRMQDGGYRHLPVVDRGHLVGIVSRRDFDGDEKARLDTETKLWERV